MPNQSNVHYSINHENASPSERGAVVPEFSEARGEGLDEMPLINHYKMEFSYIPKLGIATR